MSLPILEMAFEIHGLLVKYTKPFVDPIRVIARFTNESYPPGRLSGDPEREYHFKQPGADH